MIGKPKLSNLAKHMIIASLICIAGSGSYAVYCATYRPNATMLMPILNVNVKYSYAALAVTVACATVVLAIGLFCSNEKDHDTSLDLSSSVNDQKVGCGTMLNHRNK